jgi:hypothetical protein
VVVQVLWQFPSWLAAPRWAFGLGSITLTALASACSVAPIEEGSDADTGSTTHALVTVERSALENATEAPRAAAFAGFVRTPPAVDANAMLNLAGFGLDLPSLGQCSTGRERDGSVRLSPLARVEFLDAGDVTLRTNSTNAPLATRALPAVTDLIAGVVYTTRDRGADPIPAATRYTLSTSGGAALRPFTVNASAPALLTSVKVGSVPLSQLATVGIHSELTLSWDRGQSRDQVYVEFTAIDGSVTTRCAFRDDAGTGTVSAGAFTGTGAGQISLHRVHSELFAAVGSVDAGEVRFDFEQSANVEFSD